MTPNTTIKALVLDPPHIRDKIRHPVVRGRVTELCFQKIPNQDPSREHWIDFEDMDESPAVIRVRCHVSYLRVVAGRYCEDMPLTGTFAVDWLDGHLVLSVTEWDK